MAHIGANEKGTFCFRTLVVCTDELLQLLGEEFERCLHIFIGEDERFVGKEVRVVCKVVAAGAADARHTSLLARGLECSLAQYTPPTRRVRRGQERWRQDAASASRGPIG